MEESQTRARLLHSVGARGRLERAADSGHVERRRAGSGDRQGDEAPAEVDQRSFFSFRYAMRAAGSSLMIASTCAAVSASHSTRLLALQGTHCNPAAWAAITFSGVTSDASGETIP